MLNDKIKSLIELLEKSDINEIEVSTFWGHQKIKLKKNTEQILSTPTNKGIVQEISSQGPLPQDKLPDPLVDSEPAIEKSIPESINSEINENILSITAPLVGTFYSRSKPDSDSFVSVGAKVSKGDVVCIIEAMKIFNEIESEYSGKIIKILVEDATPVEYDQDLLVISSE